MRGRRTTQTCHLSARAEGEFGEGECGVERVMWPCNIKQSGGVKRTFAQLLSGAMWPYPMVEIVCTLKKNASTYLPY